MLVALTLPKACTDQTPTRPGDDDPSTFAGAGVSPSGARILIEPHWLTLDTIGATGSLSATVIDAEGDTVDATVTWESADAEIATIDAAGVVTSVAFGSTKVLARYDSATARATVEVAPRLTDREILEILYEAVGGDDWTDNTNWLSDRDLNDWYGVHAYQGRVHSLFLRDNNLVGTVPPELGGLDSLIILQLSSNELSGPIPPELSKFRKLRDLYLSRNARISGRLPAELGYTGGLKYLVVDQTSLFGPMPLTFASLDLTRLYYDKDRVCVPAALEDWFDSIPEKDEQYELCTDKLLIDPPSLYLKANALGDTIRLTAAVFNAEGDAVPDAEITWASTDTAVVTVDSTGLATTTGYGTAGITATSNPLADTARVEIVFKLTNRQILDSLYRVTGGENWNDTTNWLSDQPLSEWYGVETGDSGEVVGLSLGDNNLTGPIPGVLAELDSLVTLDLGGNSLVGEIPWDLGMLEQLRDLILNGNALEGLLPRSLGYMDGLRYLHIGDNKLDGVVPRSFAGLELDTLYAAGSGACVPPSLGEWFDGIEKTDSAARCVAFITINVVDLPSLNFYAAGETGNLAATYVSAEGDTARDVSATWSSGDDAVVSVNWAGTVTAVGSGETEVTATYDSTSRSIAAKVDLPENDRDVLMILYDRTRGGSWTDATGWLSDGPLSEWSGVETDDSGRVVGLSLRDNNLRGPLHSSIGLLNRLATLDLRWNWITGPIPTELGDLGLLRDIALSVNGFSGGLPWQLGQLDSLRTLNVAATSLSGMVPAFFGGLELESFRVGGTALCLPPSLAVWHDSITEADDPPECASRVSIEPSTLTFDAVGDTARLSVTVVDAEGRPVPSPAVTWASADPGVAKVGTAGLVTARYIGITTVTATYDSLTAASTEAAVRLPGSDRAVLEALYRATGGDDWTDNTNWLSDEPLGKWYGVDVMVSGHVENLMLRDNNLTGQLPAAIGLLDSLFILGVSGNGITGPIPPAIGRLRRLRDLNLRDTGLEGVLPPEIGDMTGLEYVTLDHTGLSGPLPETLSRLVNLKRFYHSGTDLCVPRSLADWYASLGNTKPLPCIPSTADRDVLVTFYNATGGPAWASKGNWLTDKSLNTWDGITTNAEGYVTDIFLPWNDLTGNLPSELGKLAYLEVLSLYGNSLTGTIPPELGSLSNVRKLYLSGNNLGGPVPPELGRMASVEIMYLSDNNLSGPIPAEFGNLVNLETLALFENELSGPLPGELGNLKKLKTMWLVDNKIEGPLPPELGDMTSLVDISLSRNLITGEIPSTLGELKKLEYLGLAQNGIEGSLPAELGEMTSLEYLYLQLNQLTGSLPARLGKLQALKILSLGDNRLTGAIPPELGDLVSLERLYLMRNELSNGIPPELGRLANLRLLWLFANQLTGPIPAEFGNLSKLEYMSIGTNELTGSIPPELGRLSAMKFLQLIRTKLTGPIPSELSNLASLIELHLFQNNLSGAIPPELGDLVALKELYLSDNRLSGPLPPELGNLVNLEEFTVKNNPDLVGLMPRSVLSLPLSFLDIHNTSICPHLDDEFQAWLDGIPDASGLWCPPTLTERFALTEFYNATGGDSWTNNSGWDGDAAVGTWHGVTVSRGDTLVRRLALPSNGLTGSIAPAIGNLRKLETLDIADNRVSGGLPAAMMSMDALDTIRISGNTAMTGPLPFEMTGMTGLKALEYANTGMCASPSATFQRWIDGLDLVEGATCDNPAAVKLSLPVVYVTQAIQRPDGNVPLLSDREALLRAFLLGDQANAFFEPEVVATLSRDGEEVHRVTMRPAYDRLHTFADEGDLRASYNAVIPAEHIVAGTELVVVADSAETVPRAEGSRTRFPESGSVSLNVIDVPPLELTAVPVLYADRPDSSVIPWVDSIGTLGAESPQVGLFRYSFPLSGFTAKAREPYVTSLDLTDEDNTWGLILEMEPVYRAERATGYWYAVADSEEGYVRGIARLNGMVSFGKPWDTELAHEVGHNLDLLHAPCGGALGVDPDFPYSNGSTGVWGYDFRDGTVVSPESRRDIMGYCYEQGWLSDYFYEKVIRVRENKVEDWRNESLSGAGPEGEMLVLWGGVLNGEPRIEPVHSMRTTPKLPTEAGAYRIEGFGRGGQAEFSLSFTPGEDKYGNKYFFFAIPIEADWEGSLERITLTGPEGETTVDANDPRSLTIVTDPATGRIRAILRDWNRALPAALGDTAGLEVRTTRGIVDAVRMER